MTVGAALASGLAVLVVPVSFVAGWNLLRSVI